MRHLFFFYSRRVVVGFGFQALYQDQISLVNGGSGGGDIMWNVNFPDYDFISESEK